jgi:DNA-binding Lrp family transcriptional regulator
MATNKDNELLALLRVNAREPVSSLARKLGASRSTVQDRIRRLEEQGAIAGYSVVLGEAFAAAGVRAFVTVSVEPQRSTEVVSALRSVAHIDSLHTVSGKFDLVALVHAESPQSMDSVLDHIGRTPGVVRTDSAIILSTKLDRR